MRDACERLLDALEARHGKAIPLEELPVVLAEYWTFNLEDAYTCAASPRTEAGDFGDDLAEVGQLVTRRDEEIYLWHDLEHVAAVLRGIAFIELPRPR
jgi:hypothetical protein